MGRIVPLILHRSEWKRIKNQANSGSTNEEPARTVDIEKMIEQSQKWTRAWPDTVEGHVRKVMRDKKQVMALEMAEVEAFHKKTKKDNTAEAMKEARNMIFERTCYGKQLLRYFKILFNDLNRRELLSIQRIHRVRAETRVWQKEKLLIWV